MGQLRQILFKFYFRAERLLTPGLRNAQYAYRETLKEKLSADTLWLDIGCGRRLFPDWMPGGQAEQDALQQKLRTSFGIDPDVSSVRDNRFVRNRVVGDSASLPFESDSFNLLTANMVVEHLAQPQAVLLEARRVLKPNGIFLFHTPNSRSYATLLARIVPAGFKVWLIGLLEGRKEEDVFPTLYRMNTPQQVEQLAKAAGLKVIELRRVESSAQAVMLGPFVLFELLWIKLLRLSSLENLRSNLIVILQKS